MLEYDNVLNKQREVIYAQRREVLESHEVSGIVQDMMHRAIGLGFDLHWAPGLSQAEASIFQGLRITSSNCCRAWISGKCSKRLDPGMMP